MPDYPESYAWAQKFIRPIKRILGDCLFTEAPHEEDTKHNTDLVVLALNNVRVACRVRNSRYFENYQNQFTIRASRPNGASTELDKLLSGWGDYLFYAIANEHENGFLCWVIIDLEGFRRWFRMTLLDGLEPGRLRSNKDGSSMFRVFRIMDLPPTSIIDRRAKPLDCLRGGQ